MDRDYSVDHINRVNNLRWATQSEQNKNTDKRTRKYNARELPQDILEHYIPIKPVKIHAIIINNSEYEDFLIKYKTLQSQL